MDSEKLIEQLEAWNEQHLSVVCGNGHFACDYLCESEDCIVVQAATALSTLQAENEKLRDELERVKKKNKYSAHDVALILSDAFGDSCACNFNGNDEWLPEKCELLDTCPDVVGVACWEQYLKWLGQKED